MTNFIPSQIEKNGSGHGKILIVFAKEFSENKILCS